VANPSAKEKWLADVRDAWRDGSFVKLTLGGSRDRDSELKSISARPVELKDGPRLSFVYRHTTRDVTKNWPIDEAMGLLEELVGAQFRHAHLFTTQATVELEFRQGRPGRLIQSSPAHHQRPTTAHDQRRHRLVDPQAGWLQALGVTNGEGQVAKGMEAKFRQINKFVEVLEHLMTEAGLVTGNQSGGGRRKEALSASESGARNSESSQALLTPAAPDELRVVDMGCGKGYLTFATYDWLQRRGWRSATVRGIESRPDLVALGNRSAKESGFGRLQFEAGAIADAPIDHADILIALHACDTATDDAIASGARAGASLIIVSPCCHKELRPRLRPPPVLECALHHGILLERQAEFVTDVLRAALLEWAGYDTKVFEFVSTEHTVKNLMIAATKRRRPGDQKTKAEAVRALAAFYGIRSQRLATNLGFALPPDGRSHHS